LIIQNCFTETIRLYQIIKVEFLKNTQKMPSPLTTKFQLVTRK